MAQNEFTSIRERTSYADDHRTSYLDEAELRFRAQAEYAGLHSDMELKAGFNMAIQEKIEGGIDLTPRQLEGLKKADDILDDMGNYFLDNPEEENLTDLSAVNEAIAMTFQNMEYENEALREAAAEAISDKLVGDIYEKAVFDYLSERPELNQPTLSPERAMEKHKRKYKVALLEDNTRVVYGHSYLDPEYQA